MTSCFCPSRKAVLAVGQFFDFGSIGDFFSSGFGQTLTSLATSVAKTEIGSALGPKPGASGGSVTVVSPAPQPQPGTIAAQLPPGASQFLTNPASPGSFPQTFLPGAAAPLGAPELVSGVSNTVLLLVGGAVLLALILRK